MGQDDSPAAAPLSAARGRHLLLCFLRSGPSAILAVWRVPYWSAGWSGRLPIPPLLTHLWASAVPLFLAATARFPPLRRSIPSSHHFPSSDLPPFFFSQTIFLPVKQTREKRRRQQQQHQVLAHISCRAVPFSIGSLLPPLLSPLLVTITPLSVPLSLSLSPLPTVRRKAMSRQQRGSGATAAASMAAQSGPRQNEYFVPRDGIDREVITADICRYLGNDALVRPGTYDVSHFPHHFSLSSISSLLWCGLWWAGHGL